MEMQVGVRRGGTFAGRVIRPRRRREVETGVAGGGGTRQTKQEEGRRGRRGKRKEDRH